MLLEYWYKTLLIPSNLAWLINPHEIPILLQLPFLNDTHYHKSCMVWKEAWLSQLLKTFVLSKSHAYGFSINSATHNSIAQRSWVAKWHGDNKFVRCTVPNAVLQNFKIIIIFIYWLRLDMCLNNFRIGNWRKSDIWKVFKALGTNVLRQVPF